MLFKVDRDNRRIKNLLEADGNSTNSTAMVKSDILREKALKKVNAPLMAYIKGEWKNVGID